MPNDEVTTVNSLEDFAAKLIEEKGFEGDEKMIADEKAWIVETLNTKIEDAIVSEIPEDRKAEFDALIDSDDDDDEKFEEFMGSLGLDYNKMAETVVTEFCEKYLDDGEEK